MNRIDDPQLVFYLRHQAQINEWSALASRVPSIVDQFLTSMSGELDGLASDLDPRAVPFRSLDTSYPKLFLIDPAWRVAPSEEQSEEDALLGIGLEWSRGKTAAFTPPPRCAYVGVWYNKDLVDEETLGSLKKAVAEARERGGQKLASGAWWLTYRYEPASGDYWSDLSLYRQQLADSIRWMWRTFAPALRSVVG
jgi:hypothetical protein